MPFRDDEEARRERIEALEKELASAQAQHRSATVAERAQEERRDELGKRVAELEKELRDAKHVPEPEPEPPPQQQTATRLPGPSASKRMWEAVKVGFWPVVILGGGAVFAYFGIQDCRPACKPIDRYVELEVPGDVTSATGVNMPIGASCGVHALFFADRDGDLDLWESRVTIACAGRQVFDAEDTGGCSVHQVRSGARWAYSVPSCSWADDELSIQWSGHTITLTSSAPSWSYTIEVPAQIESSASLYDPDLVDSRLTESSQVTAQVTAIGGAPPVQPGTSCVIDVQPGSSSDLEKNCNIAVRCGERVLRSSVGECAVRDGRAVRATGPGVTVDFASGVARVEENEGPGVPYTAALRFGPR